MGRGVLLTANLPQLQNLIKRDPVAYREEFLQQWNHYQSIRDIFRTSPEELAHHFRELTAFISQVATCYPQDTASFSGHLSSLLLDDGNLLSPDTRKVLVQNLVTLRNKNVIPSFELLKVLFPLLPRVTSSSLRLFIRNTILSDIRTANLRTKNHKLNHAVQAMLFGMVEKGMESEFTGDKGKLRDGSSMADGSAYHGEEAMWAILLTKDLWGRGVWTDAKTVSIIELGCFHPAIKVQIASIHFLLGSYDAIEEDSDEDIEDVPDEKVLRYRHEIKKKTRSGARRLQRRLKAAKKENSPQHNTATNNLPALQLLNDPQTFAEKVYNIMTRYDKRFSLDHKILLLQLLSRVMGAHKLCVLGFYTYIIRYLTYHQIRVPSILVAVAQSVHDLTPPDAITPVIRKIAQEFVHPGVGSDVITAGINAIREVCRRQPWSMEEDLLGDLVEYRKSKDKAVTSASRGILQLYRELNPGMLKRRERGKDASLEMAAGKQALPFGHSPKAAVDIEGLFLLEDHIRKLREEGMSSGGEDNDGAWKVETDFSSDSSDSDGWVNVSDDDRDLNISDSEDERPNEEKPAIKGPDPSPRVSTLATTKILTPADFALLNDLRVQAATKAAGASGGSRAKRKLAQLKADKEAAPSGAQLGNLFVLSEDNILGPRKKAKADYAERIASIEKGREGRERYGSRKGKKKKDVPSSTTNREKARNKPLMMVLSSSSVRSKKKASLREKQQKLRAHIERVKKAYR